MAVIILRRAAIALAVCITAIFGILFLQFSNGNGFILSVGALKINGFERLSYGGSTTPDTPLLVSADGITFFIDRKAPLAAVLDSGEEIALEMLSFTKEENLFSVEFERGVSLSFFTGEAAGSGSQGAAMIIAKIPAHGGIDKLRLGYRLDRGASLEIIGGALMVCAESGFYVLAGATLESGSQAEETRLEILARSPSVSYTKYESVRDVSLEAIGEDISASEEAYRQAAARLSDAMLLNYHEATEALSLTEPLAAAYLAESIPQGNYATALASLPQSFRNSGERSLLTAVFLGGMESAWRLWRQNNDVELAAYTASLEAQEPSVFEKKELSSLLIANRRANDLRSLAEIADAAASRGELTPRQAAGVLELSLDRGLFPQAAGEISDETIATCEETIRKSLRYFPSFSSLPSSLYIEENAGAASAASALEIASILYRWGASDEERADWMAAARLIFMTLLSLAESANELPAVISIPDTARRTGAESRLARQGARQSGGRASSAQAIPLGGIYPLVETASSCYPRGIPAYPRYILWSCAENISLSISSEGVIEISAEFPIGQTHYMALGGVPSFYSIRIHDSEYRSDPLFESRNASGFMYSANDGAIFIKLRQRTARETITIRTAAPPAPSAPPPPEPEPAPEAEVAPPAETASPAAAAEAAPASILIPSLLNYSLRYGDGE